MVAAAQLSIAVAQILLTVAGAVLVRRARDRAASGSRRRAFFWPLVGYAALTLLVGRLLARSRRQRRPTASSSSLFLLVPVVYDFARGARARDAPDASSSPVGAVSALVGIVQYGILNYDTSDGGRRARCRTG